jgi:hypothetical protein
MNGFNLKQLFVIGSIFFTFTLTGCLGTESSTAINDGADNSSDVEQAQPFYHSSYSKVLLPNGLTMDKKESSFVKTDSFTGGNVRFTGKLEIDSLGVFFANTMPKNGWKKVYSSQGAEILQAYTQEAATCIIKITETSFKTTVDLYVADVSHK